MLLVVPTHVLTTLRPDSPSCRCVSKPIGEIAAELTVASEVRVAIPNWRQLPARLVEDLRTLDGSVVDPMLANAEEVLNSLAERLQQMADRLAAHDRHFLIGVLQREEAGAPASTRAVLAVVDRAMTEVDVLGAV